MQLSSRTASVSDFLPGWPSALHSGYHAASPGFRIIKSWLAVQGKVPWRLQHFLEDACEKGAMRQVGASYQFRHLTLQEYLSHREAARLEEHGSGGDQAGTTKKQRQHSVPVPAYVQFNGPLPNMP